MAWIVRSTIIWFGKPLDRHFTVFERTKSAAINSVQESNGGTVSVIGITDGHYTHYFTVR